MPVIGGAFAIIVVKMLFGGIGKNFMNPALGARAFMMASWPALMTTWVQPHQNIPLIGNVKVTDAISTSTPLSSLKSGALPGETLMDLFFGQHGGVIGETCALALLAGGAYLLYRKVITINIPAAYILTVAVLTFLFPMGDVSRVQWMLTQVLSGRPAARRHLHGNRLCHQPGYPEGPDRLRHWLRPADRIHPLLRRPAGGRFLLDPHHERARLDDRSEVPAA